MADACPTAKPEPSNAAMAKPVILKPVIAELLLFLFHSQSPPGAKVPKPSLKAR